jgi:hypothetical protein
MTGKIVFTAILTAALALAYWRYGYTTACVSAGTAIFGHLLGRWWGEVEESRLKSKLGLQDSQLTFADRFVVTDPGSPEADAAEDDLRVAFRAVVLFRSLNGPDESCEVELDEATEDVTS